MNSRATPIALPTGPLAPVAPDGKPAARPVAGPVVPLTVMPGNTDELLGGAGNSSPHGDAIATRVLVKGEPLPAPAGRADDFMLQRSNDEPRTSGGSGADEPVLWPPPRPSRFASSPRLSKSLLSRRAVANLPSRKPRRRPPRRRSRSRSCNRSTHSVAMTCRGRQGAFSPRVEARLAFSAFDQRGSVVVPIRNLSTACAA